MKKILYSIKDRIITTHNIDFGVLILFSLVSIVFIISLFNVFT
jgi:hypothetical protein